MITLQPVTLCPEMAAQGVYQPSRRRGVEDITLAEFLAKYADSSRSIKVLINGTVTAVTAYGHGLGLWHIIAPQEGG